MVAIHMNIEQYTNVLCEFNEFLCINYTNTIHAQLTRTKTNVVANVKVGQSKLEINIY